MWRDQAYNFLERTSDIYLIRLNKTPGQPPPVDCHATVLCCVTIQLTPLKQTVNIILHLGRTVPRDDNSKSIVMLYLSQKKLVTLLYEV